MRLTCFVAGILALAIGHGAAAAEPGSGIKIGGICGRTGGAAVIGAELCPGVADYIAIVNQKGGVLGQKLDYTELESGYMVPRAVEAYERLKREGVVTVMNYGVPILLALTPRYMEDKIPSFNTGTGRGDAIDGTAWPYIFPGTASYWSQAGVVMKYLKDNGAKRGTKIAFLFYDNPAGRDGLPMLEEVARKEGYVLRTYPVQPPGLEMESEVTAIARDFKADWVIGSLFNIPASVSIKEFKKVGFPMNRVLSFVYGAGEADVEEAGWDIAQGYLGLQFAGVGRNFPVIQDILKMYREEGKVAPKYIGSVYYNRGVLVGALIVEGVRLAIQDYGLPVTGDKVRKGYESIRKFDLVGFVSPLNITPQDHEGGGYLRVYQVKGREWVPVSDWIRGYRDEVMALVRSANAPNSK